MCGNTLLDPPQNQLYTYNMTNEQFDKHRNEDGSINLKKAFTEDSHGAPSWNQADFLDDVESVRPITSRQVAAVALAMARTIK